MRLLTFVLSSLTLLSTAFGDVPDTDRQKHSYQSDVVRLRKIVINSLYSHKDIFLRELISNANDALEKLRLTALTDKTAWDGVEPLNITIRSYKNEDGPGGRLVITDTGIGMTPEELTANLGTLAKSGTTEFLAQAESQDNLGSNAGNLIGAFGLGFYSSFLVADRVHVSSIAAKTPENPQPSQYIFSSSADDSSFETFPDPRGNTLGRGTEITLFLKEDSLDYLSAHTLQTLVYKHSSFSSAFPIYLFTQKAEEVPDDSADAVVESSSESTEKEQSTSSDKKPDTDDNDDEVIVEEVADGTSKADEGTITPKMKTVVVDEWIHLNPHPPLWMRDPKNVSKEEYSLFYQATFKDFKEPLTWSHFSLTTESGVAFRAILYVPASLEEGFWHQSADHSPSVRLMVKHVLIMSDLGEDSLPKWASWIKVIVDADDLPLNVSRETLQSTVFLKQLKQALIKRLIQLFTRISQEDSKKYTDLIKSYGTVLKLGAVEDTKNRDKLAALTRFHTNHRNETSLDNYVESKKQGQKNIFYLAEAGKAIDALGKSVFVEKLHARGYEVLLLNEPLDEIMVQHLRNWKGVTFQDVAKTGLEFGDEESNSEEEKEELKELTQKFKPLLDWLKLEALGIVRNVIISNRLVLSPCAVVAEAGGYTANVERLMSASNSKDSMLEFAKKQKVLEINPRSPLIEGLLRRVEQLPSEEEGRDLDAEEELREVASILVDGALVRSGFEVPDSHRFFSRVDRVLRRSLGVSETAPTDSTVKPAPPVDPTLPEEASNEIPLELKSQFDHAPPVEFMEDGNPLVVDLPEHDEL